MKFYNIMFMALVAITIVGCYSDNNVSVHNEDHSIQLTAYGNGMEVYAEADPLVAGREGSFLCHLTYTDDFKPIMDGRIIVTLDVQGQKTQVKGDTILRKGIFKVLLTPKQAGEARVTFDVTTSRGHYTMVCDGQHVFDDADAADADAARREAKSAGGVSFIKELSWGVDFSTEPVISRQMGNVIRTVAQIQPSQGDETVVVAKADGIATLTSKQLTPGSSISAGQGICSIDASTTINNNLALQQRQAQTSTTSPLLPVTFEISNILDLPTGSFLEMFIQTKTDTEQTVVAAEAVLEEQGIYFVYVQLTPELFEKRIVTVGETDGKQTAIRKGVAVGERVVARGAKLVKLQAAMGSVDAESGHTH